MRNDRELLESYGTITDDCEYGWYLANNVGNSVRNSYYSKGRIDGPDELVSAMLADVYSEMFVVINMIERGL